MVFYPSRVWRTFLHSVGVLIGLTPKTQIVGVADVGKGLSAELKRQLLSMQFILDKSHSRGENAVLTAPFSKILLLTKINFQPYYVFVDNLCDVNSPPPSNINKTKEKGFQGVLKQGIDLLASLILMEF